MKRLAILIISSAVMLSSIAFSEDKGRQTQAVQNAVQPAVANAQAPQKSSEMKVEQTFYEYSSSGRRDPFLSIISASRAEKEAKAKQRTKILPPLEEYDISQIKLIAIVWEGNAYNALIGLPSGKFFNVKEGMTIGVNDGKVNKITQKGVIVREHLKDYTGALVPKDTTLRLRKEEDE